MKASSSFSGPPAKKQRTLSHHFSPKGEEQSNRSSEQPSFSLKGKSSSAAEAAATTISTSKRSILDALKPRPASSFVPRARYRDNPKDSWQELENDKDLFPLCPLTLVRDVLPPKIAAELLDQLEEESVDWNQGHWIVHGKQHLVPRKTATYNLQGDSDLKVNPTIPVEEDENNEYHDEKRPITPEMTDAAKRIAQVVKEHCPWADDQESKWKPTFALANRYGNGKDCVGWHSDHIMKLGPRPIIVGLTLGACRRFEMKQQITGNNNNNNGTSKQHQQTTCRHVSVPLPHNSLCIMWNDAQESWQHSVPRCSDDSILQHPKVGLTRISLTFRMHRPIPDLGICHCGRPAGLKAKDGKYYLFCVPYGKDKKETCNFWKPCRWAEDEASRLVRLERNRGSTSLSVLANKP